MLSPPPAGRSIGGWLWLPLIILYVQYPVALWVLGSGFYRSFSGSVFLYWPAIVINVIILVAVTCLLIGFHRRKRTVPALYVSWLLMVAGLWLVAQFFFPVRLFIPPGYLYPDVDPTIQPLLVATFWSLVFVPAFALSRRVRETFVADAGDDTPGDRILRWLVLPVGWLGRLLLRTRAWSLLLTPAALAGMAAVCLVGGTSVQWGFDELASWRAARRAPAAVSVATAEPAAAPDRPAAKVTAPAKSGTSPVIFKPVRVDADTLRQALAKDLRVSGQVVRQMHTEYVGASSSTYLISTLDLSLANQSSYGVELGRDLMLVEADTAGTFEGVYHSRGAPKVGDGFSFHGNGNESYRLSSAEIRHPDGKVTRLLGGGSMVTVKYGEVIPDSESGRRVFAPLPPKQTEKISAAFEQGSWIEDATLASLRVALPEIQVATKAGVQRFRLLAYFAKPAEPDKPWSVSRTELISIQTDTLTALLETPENNLVTRVLAANWLARADPVQAPVLLKRVATLQREGELLACCLILLNELGAPGLEDHALSLMRDSTVPVGIRRLAMSYLGRVKCLASIADLAGMAKATAEDDPLAETAIAVLGEFGDAKALEALLTLARAPENPARAKNVAESLVRTKAPAAIEELEKQGREGKLPALEALADAHLPEYFDYFAELAARPNEDPLKDAIFRGLTGADRKRAIPILIEWLKVEPPPETNGLYEYGPVVRELAGLGADAPVADLEAMARQGNLRALQVLANLDQPAACESLMRLVGTAQGSALRIALHGLETHSPEKHVAQFLAALDNTDPETVKVAISGLAAAADPTAVVPLLRLLKGDKAPEAAQALGSLGPGSNAAAFLSAVLAADDASVAGSLVDGLIDHKWSDHAAIGPLVGRLDSAAPEVQYQIIRLLRHLSQNALGPENSDEFDKEPAQWAQRWRQWAKDQGVAVNSVREVPPPTTPSPPHATNASNQPLTQANKDQIREAAERGDAAAQYSLGSMYKAGSGVEQNKAEAARWYRKAAEQGLAAAQFDLGLLCMHGEGVPKDLKEAALWFRKAAEQGNAAAMNYLGALYRDGLGVSRDLTVATDWFRKAADGGDLTAMDNLGDLYRVGQGVPRNDAQALTWYRKAADAGFAVAMNDVGWMYQKGLGVARDEGEALKWYRKGADAGNLTAMGNLAWCYKEGFGTSRDYAEAMKWYRQAADRGDLVSMDCVGDLYAFGQGVERDHAEAARWYRKAADAGSLVAMDNLGDLYRSGQGVPQNDAQALTLYRKAADAGLAVAMNDVGWMYHRGLGVAHDEAEALKWYRKGADGGNGLAMNNLGECYKNGWGVAVDNDEALRWYRKAAEAGNDWGMNNVGWMYQEGLGVARDYAEAMRWYRKGAESGNGMAMNNIGWSYQNGWSVAADYAEAFKWYRKSAEAGESTGMNNLGWLYEHGMSVAADRTEAIAWYRKAAAAGNTAARGNLERLEKAANAPAPASPVGATGPAVGGAPGKADRQAQATAATKLVEKPPKAQVADGSKLTDQSLSPAPAFKSTTSEPVLLRYKLKRDQLMKLVIDANTDIQMGIGAQQLNMGQDMRIEAKARVTEVDEKGNISVLVKITRLQMKLSGMAQVEFDSDKPDNPNPDFQAVTAMIGIGIPCKISPVGEMLETDLEPLRLAVRRVNNAALSKALEDSTSKMFEGTFIQLSKNPIATGQTYEAGTIVSDQMKMHASYKIASVDSDRTKVVMAPILVMELAPNAMPGATAKITSQEASGWLLFDLEKGYVSEAQMRIHVVSEITANGQKLQMDMTTKVRSTSSLN